MHLEQNEAAQVHASFYLKLHKRKVDAAKQEQSFRQNEPI